jgi:hypothetical protein
MVGARRRGVLSGSLIAAPKRATDSVQPAARAPA